MIDNSGRRGRTSTCPGAEGAVPEFARALWELKKAAGDPSYDRMRSELGALASKSALSAAARGERLPSWDTAWEFVRVLAVGVLGEPEDEVRARWRSRWQRARDATAADEGGAERSGETGQREPGALDHEPGDTESGGTAPGDPAPGDREHGTREPGQAAMPVTAGDRAEPRHRQAGERGRRRRRAAGMAVVVAAVVVVAAGVVAATGLLRTPPEPPDAGATPEPLAPLIPGDRSLLLSDLDVPDGTEIPTGTVFTKTWEFRNAGTVAWVGRYLRREGSFGDGDGCVTPERVPVPPTRPGETVRVSVEVHTPDEPGYCQVYWKMVDAKGRLLLPGARAAYFFVEIVD